MAHVIAVAGKGGVGKTTLCGMLIQYLCEQGKGPVLAVDADANSNLNEVLGVKVDTTLGDVREEIAQAEIAAKSPIPTGMSKADYAELRFEDALIEDDDFDLLVMGRTQGKGCYCYVNGLLQAQLAKYQNNYPYFVVDNEAGMERHQPGRSSGYADCHSCKRLFQKRDPGSGKDRQTDRGVQYASFYSGPDRKPRPKGELNPGVLEEIENQGLNLLGVVPQDDAVYEYDCEGRPTASLPEDNPVKQALRKIVDKLNL